MLVPMRDFITSSTERCMLMRSMRHFGLEVEIKVMAVDDFKGRKSRPLKVSFISREQLLHVVNSYEANYKRTGHYSSKNSALKYAKMLALYDKHIRELNDKS